MNTTPTYMENLNQSPRTIPGTRLIVLVEPLEIDANAFTSRVWQLADANAADVLLLALYTEPEQEMALRRSLATMAAIVNHDRVSAETEVVRGRDWLGVVRSRLRTGDIVVYCDGHKTGPRHQPVSQILEALTGARIYVLGGMYPETKPKFNWPSQAVAWTGSLVILAGFFLFQARADLLQGWGTVLLLLSLPIEVVLILAWNSMVG